MSLVKYVEFNSKIIDVLKDYIGSSPALDIIECFEGDYTIYHGTYAQRKPFRFFLHFIKSLFHETLYSLDENRQHGSAKDIASIITVDHLYKENLVPLIHQLEERKIVNTEIRLEKIKKISFKKILLSHRNSFSITSFLYKNVKLLSATNLISLLYIKYILFNNTKTLLDFLKKNLNSDYKLFLSAEVCDVFSRAAALTVKAADKKYILLQCGPLQNTNYEIKSIICSEFLAWDSSKKYLSDLTKAPKNKNISINYFNPPRFLCNVNENEQIIYDIVIFLTWLDFSSPKKEIDLSLSLIISHLIKRNDNDIFLKLHPHTSSEQEKELLSLYSNHKFLQKDLKARDIIARSKIILNFGSTVCLDADYLSVKTGLIDFENRFSNGNEFTALKSVKVINDINDLDYLIDSFSTSKANNIKDFSIVSYIEELL